MDYECVGALTGVTQTDDKVDEASPTGAIRGLETQTSLSEAKRQLPVHQL